MAEAQLARRALTLLDLTDLNEPSGVAAVEKLCAKARAPLASDPALTVAAVCVWPQYVATARAALAGSPVKIATVVNFPGGSQALSNVMAMTKAALADGADEIDFVIPWRGLLAGDAGSVELACSRIKLILPSHVPFKVILETGMLATEAAIRMACQRAIAGGADMLKTSTGKTAVSATPMAARILLEESAGAGRPVGVKISGGVRTTADAALYLGLADEVRGKGWATPGTFRFGASGLLDALVATVGGQTAAAPTNRY